MSKKWTKWIKHDGGECPVVDEIVRVKLRGGLQATGSYFGWGHFGGDGDIVKYKRRKPLKKNVKAERGATSKDSLRVRLYDESNHDNIKQDILSLKDRPKNRRGPFVITDADLEADSAEVRVRVMAVSGHGHVVPRRDGVRARCGGPGLCKQCASDKALFDQINDIVGAAPQPNETNASEPETTDSGTTPKPVITGPGEYVTRGGGKVTIFEALGDGVHYGTFAEGCQASAVWHESGQYSYRGFPEHDIIGPWIEPKPAQTIEGWVNVYSDGPTWGEVRSSEDEALKFTARSGYITTIRISHTVEGE